MNRPNLIKLRDKLVDYLPTHEEVFDMEHWAGYRVESDDDDDGFDAITQMGENAIAKATPEHPCNSPACCIGMGPSCGIPMTINEVGKGWPNWESYANRVFLSPDNDFEEHLYNFMFNYAWSLYNKQGGYTQLEEAIGRLTWVIQGKFTEKFKFTYYDSFAEPMQNLTAQEIKELL